MLKAMAFEAGDSVGAHNGARNVHVLVLGDSGPSRHNVLRVDNTRGPQDIKAYRDHTLIDYDFTHTELLPREQYDKIDNDGCSIRKLEERLWKSQIIKSYPDARKGRGSGL